LPGLGFGLSGDTTLGAEENDKIYEPKQNKKIVRIVTVMGYIFSVSTGLSNNIKATKKNLK